MHRIFASALVLLMFATIFTALTMCFIPVFPEPDSSVPELEKKPIRYKFSSDLLFGSGALLNLLAGVPAFVFLMISKKIKMPEMEFHECFIIGKNIPSELKKFFSVPKKKVVNKIRRKNNPAPSNKDLPTESVELTSWLKRKNMEGCSIHTHRQNSDGKTLLECTISSVNTKIYSEVKRIDHIIVPCFKAETDISAIKISNIVVISKDPSIENKNYPNINLSPIPIDVRARDSLYFYFHELYVYDQDKLCVIDHLTKKVTDLSIVTRYERLEVYFTLYFGRYFQKYKASFYFNDSGEPKCDIDPIYLRR